MDLLQWILGDDPPAPGRRSGHRMFADDNYIYLIGGFNNVPRNHILREMWKMNIVTQKWTKLETPQNFPVDLASFACVPAGRGVFAIYGGTSPPFGFNMDLAFYICRVNGNQVEVNRNDTVGAKGIYGHVMVFDEKRDQFWVLGGTDGHIYTFDVDILKKNDEGNWRWRNVLTRPNGVYRMEGTVLDDCIYLFGGSSNDSLQGFDKILVFDMQSRNYCERATIADPQHGYPIGRKCHCLTRLGNTVYMCGGCTVALEDDDETVDLHDDVWSFDLHAMTWRMVASLPCAVFFADAVIVEGELRLFGGVLDEDSLIRSDVMQVVRVAPASLYYSALETVLKLIDVDDSVLGGIRLDERAETIRLVLDEVYGQEDE